ncbi:MAG: PqqD family protein [Acutalibacteraceae bacterium]|nr:PqqD family protein [Acutalibacteraceae bacterium]
MKNKSNYLSKVPIRSPKIAHKTEAEGMVILQIQNTGAVNFIVRKILKKPQTSYIHLDKTGSFVWLSIDGNKSIYDIALLLEENFGNNSHPLYERITKFFFVLEKNGFIIWAK